MKLPTPIFGIGRNMRIPFLKSPKGPYAGASYSVRQLASTLNVQTGLSNVGGVTAAQLVLNSSTAVYFALALTLADFPQISTLGALFDQYRVEKLLFTMRARNNAVFIAGVSSPNGGVPYGYVVVDYDDSSAPASMSELQQYNNCRTFTGEEDVAIEIVPALTPAVFSTGAFSGYEVSPSNAHWIDLANTSVPFYGIKGGVGNLTLSTTSSWTWDISVEAIISFRQTR